jgi:hypothetical protein
MVWRPPPRVTHHLSERFMNCNTTIEQGHTTAILSTGPLPCLNSNISIETPLKTAELSSQHRKTAFILKESIQYLGDKFGVNYLGFLTLTFADHVTDHKEASKRLNSLISNVIKPRYYEYVGCVERMKNGRIHYHLLVVLKTDIRTGANFAEFELDNYQSASPELRKEWVFLRKTARKYKFGRTELLPIKSNTEGIAKYVGKYIAKSIENRLPEDKGARLVRYSKGARAGNTRFSFYTEGSQQWRRKLALFAEIVNQKYPEENIKQASDLSRILGKRWAFNHREYIINLP